MEPSTIIYRLDNPQVDKAISSLQSLWNISSKEHAVTRRARDKRIFRIGLLNDAVREAVSVD